MAAKSSAAQLSKNKSGTVKRAGSGKKVELVRQEEQPQVKRSKLKWILILIFLLLLGVAGFAVGIYLKLIDYQQWIAKYELQNLPVIGQYLPKVETNFEPLDLSPTESVQPAPGNALGQTPGVNPAAGGLPPAAPAIPPSLQAQELQKQAKQKQQEENKKFAKLARLYAGMAPEEAAKIMQQLDNQTVTNVLTRMEDDQAAKILAQFDSTRAAQVSKTLLTPTPIE